MDNTPQRPAVALMLNAFWNNFGRGMSGGDQMLIQLFKRMRRDFSTVACFTNPYGAAALSREVPEVAFYSSPHWFDRLNLIVNYVLRTVWAVRLMGLRVDVLYGSSDYFPDVIPAFVYRVLFRKSRWVQCVLHMYVSWRKRPGNKLRNMMAQVLQEFSLRLIRWRADKVLVINALVRDELVARGFPPERLVLNPPGINYAAQGSLEAADTTAEFDAVFMGRLNPSKGIFDLPEVWRHVTRDFPEARLAIVGGGLGESQLRADFDAAGLSRNVEILGFLPDLEAFSIVKKAHVFVFPSHEEGFGIAIADALALSVPVVAWDLPVYREVFPVGLVRVRQGQTEQFAAQVVRLLRDDAERRRLALEGHEFVARYDWAHIVDTQKHILGVAV